ncbi:hypothetical protein FHR32_001244 [Streptosporangium album]|uniref:Uncharacterized protein n=1 Tax=Streptosporangium album TaxID=47479 RepID=A0A7W7RRP7_9ACTN|nr:hypothetical protein [Streptosporangium album]MBB4936939.1 hypothetical protein [Streptosporangium album]
MAQKTATASDGRTADRAGERERTRISVPVLGELTLPPPDLLVFYAALGVLGALEIIEWPVVLVVGIGHLLAEQHHARVLQAIGQAAEAA